MAMDGPYPIGWTSEMSCLKHVAGYFGHGWRVVRATGVTAADHRRRQRGGLALKD